MTAYYKMRQILLQHATAMLLQNATEVYYKMRQVFITKNATVLLQNATVITNCDDFITKCNRYYKMRRLLQIATVHMDMVYVFMWHHFFFEIDGVNLPMISLGFS